MLSPLKALDDERSVRLVKLKEPKGVGSYWRPIDYSALLKYIRTEFKEQKMKPEPWRAHLSRGGADLVATLTTGWSLDGWNPSFGLAASNDRRRSMRFYVGIVSPADGMASIVVDRFSGQRKHTNRMNLKKILGNAFLNWHTKAENLMHHIHQLNNAPLGQTEIERLASAAGKAKLITWSRVGKLLHYMARPQTPGTVMGLLAGFGHVGAMASPLGQLDRQYNFYRLVKGKSLVR